VVTLDVSLELDGWYGDVAGPTSREGIRGSARTGGRGVVVGMGGGCGNPARYSDHAGRGLCAVRGAKARLHGCGNVLGSRDRRRLHEPPIVCYADPSVEGWLVPGMVFTVEPVLTHGMAGCGRRAPSLVTRDGALAATFEHTVAVLSDGPVVLNWGWAPRRHVRIEGHQPIA